MTQSTLITTTLGNMFSPKVNLKGFRGFTLAEVLITLVIIGVIAAMTIPTAINNMNDKNYKVAYKKAYSDINRAFQEDLTLNQFPAKSTCYDTAFEDYTYNKLKEKFQVAKACENNNGFDCWVEADVIWDNKPLTSGMAFIDNSGRAWIEFHRGRGVYLVDTNGNKGPNKFGKDRFAFSFRNYPANNNDCNIDPSKSILIGPTYNNDYTTPSNLCNYPPCYYRKWLYEQT